MEHQMTKKIKLLLSVFLVIVMTSCYYDNAEDLYPVIPDCDTTNVTFGNDIMPIINTNCTGCHSGSAPSANIRLSNYSEIVASANNGGLMGSIKHESGWSPMPKNGNKLGDCTIKKLDTWIAEGTPNN
tara:strand:+ start:18981 stop:19364 length:384 start_codon:yes stop_codon:yes gene_type:complete